MTMNSMRKSFSVLRVRVRVFLVVLMLLAGLLIPVSAMPRRAEMKRNARRRMEKNLLLRGDRKRETRDEPTEHYYDARRDVRIHSNPWM